MPRIKEVTFLTNFSESEEVFDCFGGNLAGGCHVNLTFNYNGRDYDVEAIHHYSKEAAGKCTGENGTCKSEDLGLNTVDSGDKIVDQLKIKGLYDAGKNLLYNYSIVDNVEN
jgi:hypothetical protein